MAKQYDVVIVGSGAGGGMYAKVLSEAGANVLLLDAGGHNIDRDIRHHQWRWELPFRDNYQLDEEYAVRLPTRVHVAGQGPRQQTTVFDGSAHRTYYNDHFWAKRRDWNYTFPADKPYRWVRVRALGGKTNCWDANTGRWGPREFKPASYDGFDVDWPFDYDEIAPWYSRVEKLIGVAGPDTKSEHFPTGDWMPTIASRCNELRIASAAESKFGLHAFQTPKAAITRDHAGRPACHYCGRCAHGCAPQSKFTTIGSLLPLAMATGRLDLRLNAVVRAVFTRPDGHARGVSFIDRYTFKEEEAYGRVVVLAASAIETARILLNSKSGSFPDGLANSSGQVGRNLVENVTAFARGSFPDAAGRPVTNEDGWGTGMMIAPFINVDQKSRNKNFLRRFALNIRGGFGMGAGGARGGPSFGAVMKKEIRRRYGSAITVSGSAEGLWSPHNYVDIDPGVKDAWGIPAARIHLAFGENDQAVVGEMTDWGRKLIEAAGGVVSAWQLSTSIPGGQIHEQGTCRMGDNSRRFVTDRWGTCHDVPNLVVGDGALHVTCATQNPTLTILALAMRNAYHLAARVRQGDLII